MKFTETPLKGAYVVELEPIEDERGYFARSFCTREFADHGIEHKIVQCNISQNKKKGTLRGMHYQAPPNEEAKTVYAMEGAIYDVIVDLREDSPTYCKWFGVELTKDDYKMLYVPKGFAHGFQTLTDNTILYYQMSEFYHPECSKGYLWKDPAFGIDWPLSATIMSDRDKAFRPFNSE